MKLYQQYLSEDDDFEIEDEIEVVEDDFDNYDDILQQLKKISKNLDVSGKLNQNDDNQFIYSISSRVKLCVSFDNEIDDMYIRIEPGSKDNKKVIVKCKDDTTELSNLSDYINTATLVVKEIQEKLM